MNIYTNKISWFGIVVVIVIILHIITLNVSPVAWFDEVFFMDVTVSFLENGKFELSMSPTYNKEILAYGPIYFLLTGLSIKLFGLGLFQFRMVNLLFGILSVFVFKKILVSHYRIKAYIANILTILLLIQSTYHSSLHSGRMDLVALFFVLCGYFLFLNKKENYSYAVGVLFSLALLTTPRVAVLLIGVPIYLILNILKSRFSKDSILNTLKIGVTFFFVYSIWFFYAFGSISNFISYYSDLTNYVGGSKSFPVVMYPILLLGILPTILLFFIKKPNNFLYNPQIFIPIVSILGFHLLVSITSVLYFAMIIPFYLFLFSYSIRHTKMLYELNILKFKINVTATLLYSILTVFSIILVIKIGIVYSTFSDRSPNDIYNFIERETEQNASVIADYKYGYAAKLNDLNFISSEYNVETKEQKIKFLEFVANKEIEYLIISDVKSNKTEFLTALIDVGNFKKVSEFKSSRNQLLQKIIKIVPMKFEDNYNGTLYKRDK